jgi:ATP synthase protein I
MTDKPIKEDSEEENINSSAGNFSLGISILSSILVGMAMGYGLDKFFDTAPWLMVLFIFLGFAAGIRTVWKQMEHQMDE